MYIIFNVVSINEQKQVSDSVYGTEVRGVLVFDDIGGSSTRNNTLQEKSISFKLEFTFGYISKSSNLASI